MKAPVSEPTIRPTTYNGIWRSLRFRSGKFGTDDWVTHGRTFQRNNMSRMHMVACHRFIHGLLPYLCQTGGAVWKLMGFPEELTSSSDYDKAGNESFGGSDWLSEILQNYCCLLDLETQERMA